MGQASEANSGCDVWSPPDEFEEYRVVRLLGVGAMGRVYLAEDRLLARPVAVKFIAAAAPSEAARARFYVEARAVARLSHPNVVAVHRVGEVRSRPFLVSEYVRGESLDRLPTPLDPARALAIGIGLARGLAAAHRRGVLHRDIKPANAMLSDEGEVKLLDFGLAELVLDGSAPLHGASRAPQIRAPRVLDAAATVSIDDPLPQADDTVVTSGPPSGPENRPIAGTPLYMAPEIWRGEPATPRSDVYSLGALLYHLCVGRAPHEGVPLAELPRVIEEADPVAVATPGLDPRFASLIDRCLARDASRRFDSGDALREALERIGAQGPSAGAVPEGNPYRGLLAFEAEHRGFFFGRGGEVRAVLDRLRAEPFVLVAADSGAGKSSLCRAGVAPAVAEGALGDGWLTAAAIPGRHPMRALSAALAPLLGHDEPALEDRLRAEPATVGRELRGRKAGRVLLLFDPLEELSTLADPAEAAEASNALQALLDHGSVRLLAAARSDFLARLAALPGLGDAVSRALYLLRPLSAAGLREAVVGPARVAGFSFESDALVDTLVSEAARAGGGLPLLQFTLAELWDARDEARRTIPSSALDAIGGVAGALARHADGVIAGLLPRERAAARTLLLGLVTAEGTRARWTFAEMLEATPGGRAALDALVRGRLVVAHEADAGDGGAYELAHEALIGGWDTLRGWLGDDVGKRAVRQRLERAAAEWERLGRAEDALFGDRLLEETAGIGAGDLGAREAAFLAASRRGARRRRLGRWAAAIGAPLSIALTAAAVWGMAARSAAQKRDAEVAVHLGAGEQAMGRAEARRRAADELRSAAFTRFDANNAAAGETWASALEATGEADAEYAKACQAFELALQLDGRARRARALLSDALLSRAALADSDHRAVQRDELLQRLDVYDDRGERARAWAAPAHLVVETSPPGAKVTFARFESRNGHRTAVPSPPLGVLAAGVTIPPGSILLGLSAEGRAPVRLPLLLGRREDLRVEVDLPLAGDVPEGFVYIPPGRSLYGSAGGEAARALFSGPPQHPVWTGAYLIAENETTYADWIGFLRALPPDERLRRMPRATSQTFTVALTGLPDGDHELTFGPERSPQVARSREPIRYRGRARRAEQRWLRFPVTGVSFEDVLAYAAWLDRSGRIPGARPCDEREWERAARGADDRTFPNGDRLDPDDANHDVTYSGDELGFGPDEVGSHPASDSPFGVHDLAGNVWEWTTAAARPGVPVLRGGSFYQLNLDSASFNRQPIIVLSHRSVFIGVRICATPKPR